MIYVFFPFFFDHNSEFQPSDIFKGNLDFYWKKLGAVSFRNYYKQ